MKNIDKWLEEITKEDFRDFLSISLGRCSKCPAVDFCRADEDDKCCEEEFYKWAIKECHTEGGEE